MRLVGRLRCDGVVVEVGDEVEACVEGFDDVAG
jgi:hypothetical protein